MGGAAFRLHSRHFCYDWWLRNHITVLTIRLVHYFNHFVCAWISTRNTYKCSLSCVSAQVINFLKRYIFLAINEKFNAKYTYFLNRNDSKYYWVICMWYMSLVTEQLTTDRFFCSVAAQTLIFIMDVLKGMNSYIGKTDKS